MPLANKIKIPSIAILNAVPRSGCTTTKAKGKNKINNRNEPISVKCHLTFINGHEDIIFWRIKADQVATWSKDIVGKKIESSGFKGKVKIYKVFECISTKGTFTSNQAKLLDLNKGGR